MCYCNYGHKGPCGKCKEVIIEDGIICGCKLAEAETLAEFERMAEEHYNKGVEVEFICKPCSESQEMEDGELWCKKMQDKCINVTKCN